MSSDNELLKKHLVEKSLKKLQTPIKLASGLMSDVYLDSKKLSLWGPGLEILGREFLRKIQENFPSRPLQVAGVSVGGDPLVASVLIAAHQAKYEFLSHGLLVRKEAKGHGASQGKRVEGDSNVGRKVVLVEDVLSTGGSAESALEALINEGFVCCGVIVLLDRQMGGIQKIENRFNIPVIPIFKLSELSDN